MNIIKILTFIITIGNLYGEENQKVTIAFGSCNHQNKEQILWDDIISEDPNLWIWLGDNIYAGAMDAEQLKMIISKINEKNN